MLIGISPLLNADVLHALRAMGHGDDLIKIVYQQYTPMSGEVHGDQGIDRLEVLMSIPFDDLSLPQRPGLTIHISGPNAGASFGAGTMVTIAYISSVTAMRVGDIGFIAQFRYTSLLWAIVLGWFAFHTLPDTYSLIGAAIVVATGIYTLLRERQLRAASA